jgi:hypothetical protein
MTMVKFNMNFSIVCVVYEWQVVSTRHAVYGLIILDKIEDM